MSASRPVNHLISPEQRAELVQRRDLPGILWLLGHLGLLLLTGYVLSLSLDSVWVVPALLAHGIVMVHFFAPYHECAHGTAFKTRWLNQSVSLLTGLVLLLTPRQFFWEHRAHHQHTQQAGRDPQMFPQAERLGGYLWIITAIPYFYYAIGTLIRHAFACWSDMEQQFLPRSACSKVQRQAWLMWACYGLILALSISLQSWNAWLFWLLPRLLGEPFMRLIRMSEHGACTQSDDVFSNTRTVLTVAPIRWLNWNMAYHNEHHAMAAVPFHALPKLYDLIGDHFVHREQGYGRTQIRLLENGWRNIS